MFIVTSVFRLIVLVMTDLAMLPALQIMKSNKRHFELYIGVFQFLSKTLFNASQALQVDVFLNQNDWHFISDVLSIAYYIMLGTEHPERSNDALVVHLSNIPNENLNILLRYIGFSLSWIVKQKDGWNSILYQELLILSFLAFLVYQYATTEQSKWPKVNWTFVLYGAALAVTGIIFFEILEWYDFSDKTRIERISHALVSGIINLASGGCVYCFWSCIACRKFKDDDIIPVYSQFV